MLSAATTTSARSTTMAAPTSRRAGAVRVSAGTQAAARAGPLPRLAAGRSALAGAPRRAGAAPAARRGSVTARAEISYIMVRKTRGMGMGVGWWGEAEKRGGESKPICGHTHTLDLPASGGGGATRHAPLNPRPPQPSLPFLHFL